FFFFGKKKKKKKKKKSEREVEYNIPKMCGECKKIIYGMPFTIGDNKTHVYHKECLKCDDCKNTVEPLKMKMLGNKKLCQGCAGKNDFFCHLTKCKFFFTMPSLVEIVFVNPNLFVLGDFFLFGGVVLLNGFNINLNHIFTHSYILCVFIWTSKMFLAIILNRVSNKTPFFFPQRNRWPFRATLFTVVPVTSNFLTLFFKKGKGKRFPDVDTDFHPKIDWSSRRFAKEMNITPRIDGANSKKKVFDRICNYFVNEVQLETLSKEQLFKYFDIFKLEGNRKQDSVLAQLQELQKANRATLTEQKLSRRS
ncbi:hypothetical protein RFI_27709, partial [Reticulomyxa filosa]